MKEKDDFFELTSGDWDTLAEFTIPDDWKPVEQPAEDKRKNPGNVRLPFSISLQTPPPPSKPAGKPSGRHSRR
jgi:hypothetical protein